MSKKQKVNHQASSSKAEADHFRDDYQAALEVIAEATEPVLRDLQEHAVGQAEKTLRLEEILERLGDMTVQAAEEMARIGAVHEGSTYRDHRPWMDLGIRSAERPERPNDLENEDLTPGLRIVKFNDKLVKKADYAKHLVILSDPYPVESEDGTSFLHVDARQVEDHATDSIPPDSDEGIQSISLVSLGMAPDVNGEYNTTKYVEPYINENVPQKGPA